MFYCENVSGFTEASYMFRVRRSPSGEGGTKYNRNPVLILKKISFLQSLSWSVNCITGCFGGLEVACWPLVPKFAGSNPTESRWIFQGEKILSTPSFGGEVKPSVSCRKFTACKRSLNVTWKSGIFWQNSSAISCPCSSTFGCQDLSKTSSGES